MAAKNNGVTGWVGWVYFAGVFMFMVGIFQMIAGFIALFKNDIFVYGRESIWLFNFSTWGWIHLIVGLVILLAGLAVLSGKMWGRVVGIILVLISAVVNFAFLPVYPFWSIIVLVVDALVLFALIAHGAEAANELE